MINIHNVNAEIKLNGNACEVITLIFHAKSG